MPAKKDPRTLGIPSKTLISLIYDLEDVRKYFGTDEIDYDDLIAFTTNRYNSWEKNEIKIPYSSENLKMLLREKKKIGAFNILHKCNTTDGMIDIRAENPEDLTFLKLKCNWD